MELLTILLQEGAEQKGSPFWYQMLMFGAIAVIFYLFMLRPQMKRTKEAKKFRESLAKGDKVVTAGGIHGKILEINDSTILMSTEGSGKLRVEKASVSSSAQDMIGNQNSK